MVLTGHVLRHNGLMQYWKEECWVE